MDLMMLCLFTDKHDDSDDWGRVLVIDRAHSA